MAMSIKQEYLNAVYDIQEISGELSTKNISKVNVVSNNDTRIKRIQTIVDQNNNSLKIIAQDVKDQEERIGQLELNEKEFKVEFKETVTKVEEIKSKKMYRLVIYSTNGNIFRNGQIETELYAVVYSWDDEITDTLDENQFIWTRKSNDHEADIIWNQEHFGGAKRIVITADDVYARATFFCDLIDTTTRMSLL